MKIKRVTKPESNKDNSRINNAEAQSQLVVHSNGDSSHTKHTYKCTCVHSTKFILSICFSALTASKKERITAGLAMSGSTNLFLELNRYDSI
jgi:hypothetical protein